MGLQPVQSLVYKISAVLINPFLALVFGVAFVVFIWGIVQYLYEINTGKGDGKDGKAHMLWGIVGMFIMVAAYTIIRLVANTINVGLPSGY